MGLFYDEDTEVGVELHYTNIYTKYKEVMKNYKRSSLIRNAYLTKRIKDMRKELYNMDENDLFSISLDDIKKYANSNYFRNTFPTTFRHYTKSIEDNYSEEFYDLTSKTLEDIKKSKTSRFIIALESRISTSKSLPSNASYRYAMEDAGIWHEVFFANKAVMHTIKFKDKKIVHKKGIYKLNSNVKVTKDVTNISVKLLREKVDELLQINSKYDVTEMNMQIDNAMSHIEKLKNKSKKSKETKVMEDMTKIYSDIIHDIDKSIYECKVSMYKLLNFIIKKG